MKKFFRDNGLSITVFAFFALFLLGQTLTGWFDYNGDQRDHKEQTVTLPQYLATGAYSEAVFENWESEFLQMGAYIVLTSFLFQRGSSESKDPDKTDEPSDEDPASHQDDPDAPGPVKKGGFALKTYEHSLSIAFFALFLFAFIGHVIGGAHDFNDEARAHHQATITTLQYLGTSRLWFESFQNWQSEFLAVFSICVLSIKLRERGSPESKPVHAPHSQTGDG